MMRVGHFASFHDQVLRELAALEPVDRGEWQAQKTSGRPEMMTCEKQLSFIMPVHPDGPELAKRTKANLPWAEDHFQERISRIPYNPAPSEAWWPFARKKNAEHKTGERFSHTYPERFWPVWAGEVYLHGEDPRVAEGVEWEPHHGIWNPYGDLDNLVSLMRKQPWTRQAYLPIWFPEDIYAADKGERVPCTLGYHLMADPVTHKLSATYFMRSCDMIRHFPDDVYMAGRLLQWVLEMVTQDGGPHLRIGDLTMHISNAHIFAGDVAKIKASALESAWWEYLQ